MDFLANVQRGGVAGVDYKDDPCGDPGAETCLDEALQRVAKSAVFQPEPFTSFSEYAAGVPAMGGHNPYAELLRKVMGIADTFQVKLKYADFEKLNLSLEEIPPTLTIYRRGYPSSERKRKSGKPPRDLPADIDPSTAYYLPQSEL